ncbi:MAG: hypothetical protein ABF336_09265, partial [Desulfuromonadales bacterium]
MMSGVHVGSCPISFIAKLQGLPRPVINLYIEGRRAQGFAITAIENGVDFAGYLLTDFSVVDNKSQGRPGVVKKLVVAHNWNALLQGPLYDMLNNGFGDNGFV